MPEGVTEDQLNSEVAAILGDRRLVAELKPPGHEADEIDPKRLLIAWGKLDERSRLVWRRRFGLDGQTPATRVHVARLIGRSCTSAHYIEKQASKKMCVHLWPSPFYGLETKEVNLLRRSGISRPEELPGRINEVIPKPGWGSGSFNNLEAWMISHGYPSLLPRLDHWARYKLGIKNGFG